MVFSDDAENRAARLNLAAGVAALVFAIHPLRVESVAWATERRDVVSGLFFLACIGCYLRSRDNAQSPSRRWWLTAAIIAHALSLFSKATAMTLPVVLLLLDVYPLRRLPGVSLAWFKPAARSVLLEKVPFLILAVLFGFIALVAQHESGTLRQFQTYFFSYRIAQAFYGVVFYLWKFFLPLRLSPLYELPFDFNAWVPLFLLAAATVICITTGFYLLRHRWPALFACWIYYVVVVAPVLGIAQSGPQMVADRYSYLSGLSWAVLVGGGFFMAWKPAAGGAQIRRLAVAAVSVSVIAALGFMTWNQIAVWHDTRTLWEHVLKVAPQTSIAYFNLGRLQESHGETALAGDFYARAITINPAYPDARYNLARLLAKSGRQDQAIDQYREVLKLKPDDAEARNNLGLLLAIRGELVGSLQEFQKAIDADPAYSQAFFNMGRILASQGDLVNAASKYREALKLNPAEAEIHFGLANVLARQGELEMAIKHLVQAIRLKPDFAEAHAALARSLVGHGRNEEAEEHYREALRLLKQQSTTTRAAPNSE